MSVLEVVPLFLGAKPRAPWQVPLISTGKYGYIPFVYPLCLIFCGIWLGLAIFTAGNLVAFLWRHCSTTKQRTPASKNNPRGTGSACKKQSLVTLKRQTIMQLHAANYVLHQHTRIFCR